MISRSKDLLENNDQKKKSLNRMRRCLVSTTPFIKELKAEHKFYLVGEIVIDLDIFSAHYEESEEFLPNPTNALKNLIQVTLCQSHIEFETSSITPPSSQFPVVIDTLKTIEHPRAKELALLLYDYQLKVEQRVKYGQQILQLYEKEGNIINMEKRKQESFENARKIVAEFTRNNPESVFFFVIRRKGLESIEVLKSGYSMQAIRLSGYSIQEFEQYILREAGVPINHQNSGWDYVKEKMYSNFHNKNYSGVRRRVSVKDGVVFDVLVSVTTVPLNKNLSPNPILIDINDYLEIIQIIPTSSSSGSISTQSLQISQTLHTNPNNSNQELSKDNSQIRNQQYAESSKKFIEKFYQEKISSVPEKKRKSRKIIQTSMQSKISAESESQHPTKNILLISEHERISSDIERDHVGTKCSEQARSNDSEEYANVPSNQQMEEEDQHDENIEEENSEYSVTNYFDGNHCPLIE